ncbi:MAG: ABC transporter ATP-binding protein [Candidatus Dormibacteria bacterium]
MTEPVISTAHTPDVRTRPPLPAEIRAIPAFLVALVVVDLLRDFVGPSLTNGEVLAVGVAIMAVLVSTGFLTYTRGIRMTVRVLLFVNIFLLFANPLVGQGHFQLTSIAALLLSVIVLYLLSAQSTKEAFRLAASGGAPIRIRVEPQLPQGGASAQREVLYSVRGLTKHFPVKGGLLGTTVNEVQAVTDISFDIYRGETIGLVGESGCGKTTTGRLLLRLLEATRGQLIFDGRDIRRLTHLELKPYRAKMQIIFQDPYASLNPRLPVGDIIGEGLYNFGVRSAAERERRVAAMLDIVGLRKYYINRYPHEFSGGQRQRIGIARALILKPSFVIADEPVSALDVSIQAQVLNLLKDLQDEFKLTYVFISHNLSVVQHVSDRVGVMYLGKLAELADSTELYAHPKHPYTQALLSAIPIPDPQLRRERILLDGDVPSPIDPPSGCRFHTRCPIAQAECTSAEPVFEAKGGNPRHLAACHFAESSAARELEAKTAL